MTGRCRRALRIFFIPVALAALAAACANRPPVIESITVTPEPVSPNGTAKIEAVVSDPEGDSLRFEWQAAAGSLSAGTADTVTWLAPKLVGDFSISLAVRDSHENLTDTTFTVTVGNGRSGAFPAGR